MNTQLHARLFLPETRTLALADIAQAYAAEGSLGRAAGRLGISLRTLQRWIACDEGVDKSIKYVRKVKGWK